MSSFIELKLNYVYLSPYVCLGRSHALILDKTNERYKTLLECPSATGSAYFDAVLYLVWPWFISVCAPSRQRTPSNKKFRLFAMKIQFIRNKAQFVCKIHKLLWNMHTSGKYYDYCDKPAHIFGLRSFPFILCSNATML